MHAQVLIRVIALVHVIGTMVLILVTWAECSGMGFPVTDTLNGDTYTGNTYCAYNVVSHLKLSAGLNPIDVLSNEASSVSDPTKVTMSYTLGVEQVSGCEQNSQEANCLDPCKWDGFMCL